MLDKLFIDGIRHAFLFASEVKNEIHKGDNGLFSARRDQQRA